MFCPQWAFLWRTRIIIHPEVLLLCFFIIQQKILQIWKLNTKYSCYYLFYYGPILIISSSSSSCSSCSSDVGSSSSSCSSIFLILIWIFIYLFIYVFYADMLKKHIIRVLFWKSYPEVSVLNESKQVAMSCALTVCGWTAKVCWWQICPNQKWLSDNSSAADLTWRSLNHT